MTYNAVKVDRAGCTGNIWAVFEAGDNGEQIFLGDVAIKPGDGAAEAIACYVESLAPETPTADMVRGEARRRILAIYPEWRQMNMTDRRVELLRAGEANWTEGEAGEAAALQAAWDWIKAVRAASNAMEGAPPEDFTDDSHWPASA
ncbi:hypothetical protein [Parvibaculum sp.]|uniref:hypothetical protein n=1 Tax=Parvibaculum sp. TaxID=2024848 RepID=UPI0026141579|nr:hypothetical protein [Parvibaculum sp.]MCW5727256.1 hypothetical protein [Parvibaculum sp.]